MIVRRAERLALCPFSAACEWIVDALRRHDMLCRLRPDLLERGRRHDEVEVCPRLPAGRAARAVVRLRIAHAYTRIIVEAHEEREDVLDYVLGTLVEELEHRERMRRSVAAPADALHALTR